MRYDFTGAFARYICGLIAQKRAFGFDYLESERILRNLEWINDARIIVSPSKQNHTQIDIEIIVQDNYPHAISLDLGSEKPEVSIYTRNFVADSIPF